MRTKILSAFFLVCLTLSAISQDTLTFRIKSFGAAGKDPNGQFFRKAVRTDSGWLALDYNPDHLLMGTGFYTDTGFATKVHRHQSFDISKGYLREQRFYKNGMLHGPWTGFNENGDTLWLDDYQEGKRVNVRYYHTPDHDTVFRKIQYPPQFPGGSRALLHHILTNIQYRRQEGRELKMTKVTIGLFISESGKVSDVKLENPVDPDLGREIIRLMSSSPDWKPAEQNGKNVPMRYQFTIHLEW
ncbi:MAG TPA: energy transducer TonB [Flavisolibacter sp.]|nr:energy transducer TonB [Flavisolibacter sp.]